MANIHLSDGTMPVGKFIAGIGKLNIHLATTSSMKRCSVEREKNEESSTSTGIKNPKIVFTAEAIEALRMSQAGFVAYLGSEIESSFVTGGSDEVLKKKDEKKSISHSEREKLRTVNRKVVESSLGKIGMNHNLSRCKDNLQYWIQIESEDQIENVDDTKKGPEVDAGINEFPDLPTAEANETGTQKVNTSEKKRKARLKQKKMKNVFKKGKPTDDLLAEQERLFAISAEKAMKNLKP